MKWWAKKYGHPKFYRPLGCLQILPERTAPSSLASTRHMMIWDIFTMPRSSVTSFRHLCSCQTIIQFISVKALKSSGDFMSSKVALKFRLALRSLFVKLGDFFKNTFSMIQFSALIFFTADFDFVRHFFKNKKCWFRWRHNFWKLRKSWSVSFDGVKIENPLTLIKFI